MKYKIMLGEHRGYSYTCTSVSSGIDAEGYLPLDMLPDGTIVTIERAVFTGWLLLNECNNYVYPPSLLIPVPESKIATLLNHVRMLNET